MGFSRQEYWNRLPCPPPGDLPNPGIDPKSPVSPALQENSLPLSHQGSKSTILQYKYPSHKRCGFDSWVRKIPWRSDMLPTAVFLGFPGGSTGKESTCNAGDLDSIPGLGWSPGEGNGNPLQYSFLENLMDRGAWQAIAHGVAKSWTQLSG